MALPRQPQNPSNPSPANDIISIPQLVSELRVTFLTRDFDSVERALLERESRLNSEIELKNREIGSLQEKIEIQRLERINELNSSKDEKLVKKEVDKGLDLVVGTVCDECMHCLELKRELDDVKGAVAGLRKRNGELEEERRRAVAEVESWKGKFCELSERVGRLESGAVNAKLAVDGGGNNGEHRIGESDGHESGRRDEGVGLSSRKLPIIPSKDGLGGSESERSRMRTLIEILSDKDEGKSRGTLQRKETAPQIMADNELPSSPEAVQPKNLPIVSPREVGININLLDGLTTDTSSSSSSSSSSSGSLDLDQLPVSSLTSRKKMRTEPASLGLNCSLR